MCPVSQGCGGDGACGGSRGRLLQSGGSPGRGTGHEAPEPAMELSLLPLPPLTAVSHAVCPLALASGQDGVVCVARALSLQVQEEGASQQTIHHPPGFQRPHALAETLC